MTTEEGGAVGPDCMSELVHELRVTRVKAGRSLKELARLTASSDSSLSRYLSGVSVPPWAVVQSLCEVAQRDPQELAPLWEAAQRAKIERRAKLSLRPDRHPPEAVGTDTSELLPDSSTGRADEALKISTAPPDTKRHLRSRRVILLAIGGIGVAAIAVTVSLLTISGDRKVEVSPSVADSRVCPWHYVVTDGDPAPVLIANSTAPDRKHIGIYEPGQIFYAPDPPVFEHGGMRTLDGWITRGNWIQRYKGPCLKRSEVVETIHPSGHGAG